MQEYAEVVQEYATVVQEHADGVQEYDAQCMHFVVILHHICVRPGKNKLHELRGVQFFLDYPLNLDP